jgi:hypothetical protein
MTVTIEWLVEQLEDSSADADIIDTSVFDTLEEARAFAVHCELPTRLGLVRDRGNDLEGIVDRQWAYVVAGALPERFDWGGDEEGGALVPARYHRELRGA